MEQLKMFIFIGLITFLSIDETLAAGRCYIHGDPHFTTLDGLNYTFAGEVPCDYVLATYFDFKVVGTFIACRTSCLARIAIDFAGRTFILGPGDAVESGWTGGNMNTLDLPFNYPNIQVVDNGDHISVTLGNGVSVQWDKHKSAIIEVPESYMNSGQGMCGYFDGNPDNDLSGFDNANDFGMVYKVTGSCV